MPPTPKIKAKVNQRKFVFENDYQQKLYLSQMEKLNGKDVSIVLGEWKGQRSNSQNKYYWGYLIPTIAKHFGYHESESNYCHETLKEMFLGQISYNRITKSSRKQVKSTSDLTTTEAENYYTAIRTRMSAEFNLPLLLPNEVEMF